MKDVPKIVQQQEMQNETQALSVKGTVKVAVLKNDPDMKDLVAISYYDSKPIYFLTTVLKSVKWTTLTKKVYNPQTSKMYHMKFLRPNFADEYNQDMDHVNITNHLAKSYQIGRGLLNRKWWWPIFLWALERSFLNAYVIYSRWHKQRKLPFKSHYKFRKDIALAWLDPARYWPHRYKEKRQKRKQPEISRVEVPRGRLRRNTVVTDPDVSSLSNASSSASTVKAKTFRCTKLTDTTIRSVHLITNV